MDTQPTPINPEQQPAATSSPEATPSPELNAVPAPGPTTPAPVSAQPVLTADEVAAVIASTPAVTSAAIPGTPDTAVDQDVIEPEWVDKAESVIQETAGNPYAEEEAVENLQIDYLQKRYGHEVKKPEGH